MALCMLSLFMLIIVCTLYNILVTHLPEHFAILDTTNVISLTFGVSAEH